MTMTIPKSTDSVTFFPGQRFRSSDLFGERAEGELVVSRLVRDPLGLLHVVLRDQASREISAYAEQVEAAIAEGHLAPLASAKMATIPA